MTLKKIINIIINIGLVSVLAYLIYNYYHNQPKVTIGQLAQNFEFTTLNNSTKDLKSFEGQYVLIDFWASWCGPCRRANPDLVKFHNTFKDSNVAIISISLDKNKLAWQKAIKEDHLAWDNHSLDLVIQGKSISTWYDVKQIPTKFLIDPKGKIVGVNLSYRNMTKLLQKRL